MVYTIPSNIFFTIWHFFFISLVCCWVEYACRKWEQRRKSLNYFMTIARLFLKISSLSNRCLGNEPALALPPHPSIFLAEICLMQDHYWIFFLNFCRVMFVFILQKIVTWCLKKCHPQTMNCSSTNWLVILISFIEVWRNKTFKFRWKVGENENLKAPACVVARAR